MHLNYLICDSCDERMELTDPHVRIEPGDASPDPDALTFHIRCFHEHCHFVVDEHQRTCLEVVKCSFGSYGDTPLIYTLGYYLLPTQEG